ncbi:MAG: signal peptidase II [Bacillota bacterium]
MTLSLAALVLALDQIAKYLVMASLVPGQIRTLIPHILQLTYVRNPGAAYGLLSGNRWLLAGAALLLAGLGLYLAPKLERTWERAALGLLIGGALGNMVDRVRWGLVTDFIEIQPLPIFQVFNLADMAITLSVAWAAVTWLLESRRSQS